MGGGESLLLVRCRRAQLFWLMTCLMGDGTITLQTSGGGGVEDSRYGRLPMTRAGRAGARDWTRLLSVCVLIVLAGAVVRARAWAGVCGCG